MRFEELTTQHQEFLMLSTSKSPSGLKVSQNTMDLQENTRRLLVKLMMEDQVLEDNIKHKKRRA